MIPVRICISLTNRQRRYRGWCGLREFLARHQNPTRRLGNPCL